MDSSQLSLDLKNPLSKQHANLKNPPKLDFRSIDEQIIFRAEAEEDGPWLHIAKGQQIFKIKLTRKRAQTLARWLDKVYEPWAETVPLKRNAQLDRSE